MAKSSNCRLGVVGVGPLVGLPHAQCIVDLDGAELCAVCDLNPDVAAKKFGVSGYTDAKLMMEKERLQGVVIATPTHLHLSVFRQLVSVPGSTLKAVLVEKPICESVTAAQDMINLASSLGVKILVGHQRRHSQRVKVARDIVCNTSNFGMLRGLSCKWVLLKPDSYFDSSNPARAYIGKKGKGGPILINLIHDIDLIRYITGRDIVKVFAATADLARANEVEDTGAVTLVFDNGSVGTLIFSDASPSCWNYEFTTGENKKYPPLPQNAREEDCYHFFGGKRSLCFPSLRTCSYRIDEQLPEPGWDASLDVDRCDWSTVDPLAAQMQHFLRVCEGIEEPVCCGYDGLLSLVATLAIEQSASTGLPVNPAIALGASTQDGIAKKLRVS